MTMRDFSCFRDAAVTTVSSSSAADAHHLDRSLQAATSCVYRVALSSSSKDLLVTVTWTRSLVNATVTDAAAPPGATGLSLAVQDVVPLAPPKQLIPPSSAAATPRRSSMPSLTSTTSQSQHKMQLHTKRRGSRSFVTEGGTAVAVHWDTSNARYPSPSCPEPCGEYHLAVVADGELALLLGTDISRRFGTAPRQVLVSRREQLRAPQPPPATPAHSPTCAAVAHSTRCRFRDGGAEHEVTVRCRGDRRAASADEGEVAVSVDGRTVVEARRVAWNFRGNRTAVLPDGAIVEVMWDVHDWWFATTAGANGTGAAQFMVKARSGGGGGVWMDEEMASKGHPPAGFFLHMQCYRR
uniref:Uncharacterized protein n=1 Tax=Avena sativa TaxID=4498 RepID=A0ACD5YEM5_AVESA